HVTARFQVEFLADSLARDRFADCKAVPLLNERDIINDESAPLPEGGEVLDHAFRAEQSIAAAIESPGAAERAVPRTPARKFDRRAGIEHAAEVFMALADRIALWPGAVETADEGRPRTLAVRGDRARPFMYRAVGARHGFKQLDDGCLALALEHTIDRALAMLQNGLR